MELDDMKLAWQALDRRLERQEALNWRIFRDGQADRLRRKLRPLVWWQSAQILLGIAIALWGISFWTTHRDIWQAMVCGIIMQAFGTLAVIFTARVLHLVRMIDYTAPVVEIQRRIARLRAWRVKVEAPVFAVLGSLIWIPAMLMLIQYAADTVHRNTWERAPGLVSWLLLCGVVSLSVVGLVYALLHWLGRIRWLEDNFAGTAVMRAETMLREIASFERE